MELILKSFSISSFVKSPTALKDRNPAQLISMSRPSKNCSALLNKGGTVSRLDKSTHSPEAFTPFVLQIWMVSFKDASFFPPAKYRFAPSFERRTAMAAPIPVEAPVMKTFLSFSFIKKTPRNG